MVVCTLVMASSPPEGLTPGNCACCLPSLARGSNSAYTPGALNRQAVDSSCTLKIAQPTLSLTVSTHDVFLLLALLSSLPLQRAVFPGFPVMALFPLSDSPPGRSRRAIREMRREFWILELVLPAFRQETCRTCGRLTVFHGLGGEALVVVAVLSSSISAGLASAFVPVLGSLQGREHVWNKLYQPWCATVAPQLSLNTGHPLFSASVVGWCVAGRKAFVTAFWSLFQPRHKISLCFISSQHGRTT